MGQSWHLLALSTLLLGTSHVSAQCHSWVHPPRFSTLNSTVRALATWDPDGSGPLEAVLVAGGHFTTADGLSALRVAQWNGQSWEPLGSGFNAAVNSLAVVNGELFAGGDFTASGQTSVARIARWTGTAWVPVGSGLGPPFQMASVEAMIEYEGQLIATGTFTRAGALPVNCVARWTGLNWEPLGSGLDGTGRALALHNDELVVGGQFTTAGDAPARNVAKWSVGNWHQIGDGVPGTVLSLASLDRELIVAGSFWHGPRRNISRWDGETWSEDGLYVSLEGAVNALVVHEGLLFAAGAFTHSFFHWLNRIGWWGARTGGI